MNGVIEALRRVSAELRTLEARVALVGGLAVSARAEPRFTRDVDLAVAVADDSAAEALIRRLQERGYRVMMLLEQDAVGRLATVRLAPPEQGEEGLLTDLLFASSGIEAEIVAAAEPMEILPGLTLPVASVAHLVAMKLLSHHPTRRPRDGEDLIALLRVASEADLRAARAALALITARGFHRGRDLEATLGGFLGD